MCESEIESHLLGALYPNLDPDAQKEIEAQHIIDYYDMPLTIPDFAFPDAKIAIYCDSYKHHWERDSFQKDRQQSRELQVQGWFVLRFTGAEILNDTDAVIFTIQQAIKQKAIQKADRQMFAEVKRRSKNDKEKPESQVWGFIAGTIIVAIVVMILIEYFFPALF